VGGWWAYSYYHLEEKFDIWMGSSQTMATKKTKEFAIQISNLLVNLLMNHASKAKFNL
jgi:hypothetical protein